MMEDNYARYLIGAGVPNKKIDDCMAWAFGGNWRTKELGDCKEYWNKHHNFFKIIDTMPVGETLFKIGLLYITLELKVITPKNERKEENS